MSSDRPNSIGILFEVLNEMGGGGRVCLAMVEALLESGYDVTLLTTDKTNWDLLKKFGISHYDTKAFHEKSVFPFGKRPKIFGLYQRLAVIFYVAMRYRNKFDITISNYGDLVPIKCDYTYLNFPSVLYATDITSKFGRSIFWKLYFLPFLFAQRLVYRNVRHTKILCNSRFTQNALKSLIADSNDVVLYPPLELDIYKIKSETRQNIVATCGRIVPDKNLEIIPEIASKVPGVEFHIIGSTNQYSGRVIEKINRRILQLGINNVFFHLNASLAEQLEIYSRSKVYLHTKKAEHFGIAIVEGMAAGLVPLVHRSGGAYLDIVEEDRYGFSYETPLEASEKIKSLTSNDELFQKYSSLARNRCDVFKKDRFKKEFLSIIQAGIQR